MNRTQFELMAGKYGRLINLLEKDAKRLRVSGPPFENHADRVRAIAADVVELVKAMQTRVPRDSGGL